MYPEELPIPKGIHDALECLRGEGWDNEADAVLNYIIKQRTALEVLGKRSVNRRKALVEAMAANIYYRRGAPLGWEEFASHPDNRHFGDKPEKFRQYARQLIRREGGI